MMDSQDYIERPFLKNKTKKPKDLNKTNKQTTTTTTTTKTLKCDCRDGCLNDTLS